MQLKAFRRRRGALPQTVGAELEAELRSPVPWMYPWQLTLSVGVPFTTPELADVHRTRLELIEPVVRQALSAAGPRATAIDLGCNEGWFAHRLLEWGAARVVGVDIRDVNIKRARLIRDHFGVAADRLSFERASLYDLDVARLGVFDVVLVLGLIYHLEDPIGALRISHALTRRLTVVESQLTASDEPIRVGCGQTDVFLETLAHWAAIFEPAPEQADDGNPRSSFGGVLSLVPNRTALLQAMEVIGYRKVRTLAVPSHLNRQYVEGNRAIAVGEV